MQLPVIGVARIAVTGSIAVKVSVVASNLGECAWLLTRNERGSNPRLPAMGYKYDRPVRDIIAALKAEPCADCGQRFPAVCMDFDHVDPETKSFGIARAVGDDYSLQRILDEIEKCELVCANCHRIRTASRK